MMKYALNNNIQIPSIGFGTWKLKNDESTTEVVKNAIKQGRVLGYNKKEETTCQ